MAFRRQNAGNTSRTSVASTTMANGHAETRQEEKGSRVSATQVIPAVVDLYSALSLVFGGCCSNVLAYEQLLLMNPRIGSALTFSQMFFVALLSLPSFLNFSQPGFVPRLKPRQVPLAQWALQVLVLLSGSLLNNWAFAYNVPSTILIVFRSAGLPVSMLFGYIFSRKQYIPMQIFSVVIVTAGVIMVALSGTNPGENSQTSKVIGTADLRRYSLGIGMLTVSLFCTGLLGVLQERTYEKYGPCWKEGVFYTHSLSLPVFLFLGGDIKQGITSLINPTSTSSTLKAFVILLGNLVTQLICVSGVNRLTSQVSSVSTNIALTARKALSLCFSVWWFGNEWNLHLGIGALMVFSGSLLYSLNGDKANKKE